MDVVTALLGQSMGWRKVQSFGWVLIFLGAAMIAIPFIFHGIVLESWRELFENLYIPAMILTIGISVNVLTPIYRRRITHFREVLDNPTAGLHHAAIQPTQNYETMSLPATLELVGRRQVALGWMLATYAGTLLVFLLWQKIADILAVSEPFLLMVAFTTLFFAVIAAIVVALPRHEEIRITEEGLTVRTNESHTIRWEDVRIFAIVGGWQRSDSTTIYALSSGRSGVRWSFQPHTHWYSWTAPTTSDEVYNQQMNALLGYITARTGLPLLDLR